MSNQDNQKISLISFIMIIMTSVFGFTDVAVAYNQMGYASIIWYIFAALTFCIPTSFMFAEYGAAIKNDHGGVYSWLDNSIGTKWAFIGSFIWLCEWVLILVNCAPRIWVAASTMIFGKDFTTDFHIASLSNNESMAVISTLSILVMTFIATKGIGFVAKLASAGGYFVTAITLIFAVVSIFLIFANHGHLVQPVDGIKSFIVSPNPQFKGGIAIMSFVVYAIYAYGGIEAAGGLVDKMKNPTKNFPRGIMIAAFMITFFYIISIFFFGFSINWENVIGKGNVTLQNVIFVLMYNVGTALGHALGLSAAMTNTLGYGMIRLTGISILMGTLGTIAIIVYSPIKSFIIGSPAEFWPKKLTKINKHDMPANAMWAQAIIIAFILLFTAFGGSSAQQFYEILYDMMNISNACPYIFLAIAFPFFKKRKDLERPFVFYKNQKAMLTVVTIVVAVLVFGIIFNIIQPILVHDYKTAFWTVVGPIFFGGIAWILYAIAQRKIKINK